MVPNNLPDQYQICKYEYLVSIIWYDNHYIPEYHYIGQYHPNTHIDTWVIWPKYEGFGMVDITWTASNT